MNGKWHTIVLALLLGMMQLFAQSDMPQLTAEAKASVSAYAPGQSFELAIQADIPAPWHAYWRNPATVGEALQVELQAPDGFSVEGPFWQAPTLHTGDLGTAYIYEKPLMIWRITPQQDAPAEARFTAKLSAQLCSDTGCLPPQEVEAEVSLSRGEPTAQPTWGALEQQVETLGDTPLSELHAYRTPEGVSLCFRDAQDLKHAYFFSDDNSIAPAEPQILTGADGSYELRLHANAGNDPMYPAPAVKNAKKLSGILTYGEGKHMRIDLPIETQSAGMPSDMWSIALGLFLGGLLLNLMPCVFPVLGLKIMGFVSLSGGSRSRVVWHSLAFVLGILVSFWALGVLLVALSNAELLAQAPWHDWAGILWGDEGATDRNWATWMQNEWVVYGILLLLLALGLGMYGIFEIGARATGIGSELQQKGGFTGSFFQGLLVTVVATPCSAPFLGAAMPAAMSLPAVWMLLALTAMALGLALPYIVLGLFPSLVRLLPRPGAWMESLKQGLSFFLFAAAAWMLDVYLAFISGSSRSADTAWVLMSLVVFCSAFWVFGRWCALYRSRMSRWVGLLAALALAAVGIWGSMPGVEQQSKRPEWVTWSPEAMSEALEEGSPVYVDFTAKWCATCQSNKKLAYTDDVYKLMDERDVVLMRADKTQPNAAIDAELHRLHRSAVPTNALYLPGKDPIVTRELLTAPYLREFLEKNLPAPHEDEE